MQKHSSTGPVKNVRSASDNDGASWLVPSTILWVVIINVAILGYAIYYVAHGTQEAGQQHEVTQTSAHTVNVADLGQQVQVENGSAVRVENSSAVRVENMLNLPEQTEVRKMYVQHCAACHGMGEKGDGPAAVWLFPQPRNFVDSSFRFATTGGTPAEVIAGLENTIAKGIPRSAMPGFEGVLGEDYIAGLAHYVLDLQKSQGITQPVSPLVLGERPPTTSSLVLRGAALYKSIGCVTCHGENGGGEGLASKGMVDSLGRPIVAADFRQGLYKSGGEPVQLARTIVHGVPGTPMNGYEGALVKTGKNGERDATDVWALVAYVRDFAGKGQLEGVSSGGHIRLHESKDALAIEDPVHPAWLGIDPVRIRLQPLWRRDQVPAVLEVRAMHFDGQLAVCLDWNDTSMDIVKTQGQFSDGVAMMLAMGDDVPALPMGVSIPGFKAKAPVNIWHWQAHRQAAADVNDSQISDAPKSEVDPALRIFKLAPSKIQKSDKSQPEDVLPEYRTAVQAQNVLAALETNPALEANAIGFGTLKLQPAESQQLHATAVWTNGHWRVVVSRPWLPHDDNDVAFEQRTRIPVSFAVWDGSLGDRGGKKLVSGWHWLIVNEPPSSEPADSTPPVSEAIQVSTQTQ